MRHAGRWLRLLMLPFVVIVFPLSTLSGLGPEEYPSPDFQSEEYHTCFAWSELADHTSLSFNRFDVCPDEWRGTDPDPAELSKLYKKIRASFIERLRESPRVARTRPFALQNAIRLRDLELAGMIIRNRADVNYYNHYAPFLDNYPLFEAIRTNQPEMVKLLLVNGARQNANDCGEYSALGVAAVAGNIKIAKILIDHGADVNASDYLGMTALQACASPGNRKMADFLIKRGANPDIFVAAALDDPRMISRILRRDPAMLSAIFGHQTPLHVAAAHGCIRAIDYLLERGIMIDSRRGNGPTALQTAIEAGQETTALHLLARGANPGIGRTEKFTRYRAFSTIEPDPSEIRWETTITRPIDSASQIGMTAVVEELIARNEDVQGKAGGRSVVEASRTCQAVIVKLLVNRGADVNGEDWIGKGVFVLNGRIFFYGGDFGNNGMSPLSLAIQYSDHNPTGCARVIDLLLDHGADFNALNLSNETPLCQAARNNSALAAESLIRHGANVNDFCRNQYTPLDLAIDHWKKNRAVIDVLISHGGKVWRKGPGGKNELVDWSPSLADLVESEDIEGIKALVRNEPALLNLPDDFNHWTPLQRATSWCFPNSAKTLLELGADAEAVGLDMAAKDCAPELVALLLDHGAKADQSQALVEAIRARKPATVRLLLDHGADPSAEGVLEAAASGDNVELMKELLHRNAALNDNSNQSKRIKHASNLLLIAAENWNTDIARLLLDVGADVSVRDKQQHTPIWNAIYNGDQKMISLLRAYGSEYGPAEMAANNDIAGLLDLLAREPSAINYIDRWGDPLIHTAAAHGQIEMVEFLLRKGMDINHRQPSNGRTPLFYAVNGAQEIMIEYLVRLGADLEARDKDGNTPLIFVTGGGCGGDWTCNLLLDLGADPTAVNNKGIKAGMCRCRE